MVNYQLGKIYKIVCRITGEVYIGSTCEKTLARRLAAHLQSYRKFLKQKTTNTSSFQIISRGQYYIDLLEIYPCNSNDELRKKEREYFDKIECINRMRPYVFYEERRAYNNDNQKKYVEKNREAVNERQLLCYHKNKKLQTEEEKQAKILKKQQERQAKQLKKQEYNEAKRIIQEKYIEDLKNIIKP